MAKNIFNQMHRRASKAADCRIQMHLSACHGESLPQPRVSASKIPGVGEMLNGAGNKLRANTTIYTTACKESGEKRPLLPGRRGWGSGEMGRKRGRKRDKGRWGRRGKEREGGRERLRTKESTWRSKQSWEGKAEKIWRRTYQKCNCRKQRMV